MVQVDIYEAGTHFSKYVERAEAGEDLIIACDGDQVAKLPVLNEHKDSFDRFLVAQSMREPLVLLTADAKVVAYGGLIRAV